nr:AlNc14C868G12589 [Albugo laibachii Nc14]|eukprot:CCA27947.1 AlNc14C868G12589 [Albugo laibachii Nc14]
MMSTEPNSSVLLGFANYREKTSAKQMNGFEIQTVEGKEANLTVYSDLQSNLFNTDR